MNGLFHEDTDYCSQANKGIRNDENIEANSMNISRTLIDATSIPLNLDDGSFQTKAFVRFDMKRDLKEFIFQEAYSSNSKLFANTADGFAITVTIEGKTKNGEISLDLSGRFTYVPDIDFEGEDTFVYTLRGKGGSVLGLRVVIDTKLGKVSYKEVTEKNLEQAVRLSRNKTETERLSPFSRGEVADNNPLVP